MRSRWFPRVLIGTGVLVSGSGLLHIVLLDDPTSIRLHWFVVLVVIVGAGLGVLYGGFWHADHEITPGVPNVVSWIGASVLLFVSVGIISLYTGSVQVSPQELFEALHILVSVGLAVGLLFGTVHAQAVHNAEAAARSEAEAETLRAQKENLKDLNYLLRHYILNGANVIEGYASQLESTVPDDERATVRTIETRSQMMATLVEHVESLPELAGGGVSEAELDIGEVLDKVLADLPETSSFTIDCPDDLPTVRTTPNLSSVLYLLVRAVQSHATGDGEIRLECRSTPGTISFELSASPAELTEEEEASVFKPVATETGLQLYLAKRILARHGELELVANSDQRLMFALRLPRHPRE